MSTAKRSSLYVQAGRRAAASSSRDVLEIGATVRRLRRERGLSGVALCRASGELDPKTLTALEKGRIRNPSIQTLRGVCAGLGLSISELFREAEMGLQTHLSKGTQKGSFTLEFPKKGLRIISYTPLVRDFFCGKLILQPRTRIEDEVLGQKHPVYLAAMVGRIEVIVGGRSFNLKEGENLFFDGSLRHSLVNPLQRECTVLLVTAPSFLGKSS